MSDAILRIDDKGRLTLPREMREGMGLHPGDWVFIRSEAAELRLAKAENPFDVLVEHAREESAAGETIPLREFARQNKIKVRR